jgi:hypothetical protein
VNHENIVISTAGRPEGKKMRGDASAAAFGGAPARPVAGAKPLFAPKESRTRPVQPPS